MLAPKANDLILMYELLIKLNFPDLDKTTLMSLVFAVVPKNGYSHLVYLSLIHISEPTRPY